jgi:pimeloyl-ACP methyl ester carboxylesterase
MTQTTGSAGVAERRLAMPGGEIQVLRGGEGPPLLLLHGGGGASTWTPLHEALSARFDVIAPDHPGMGRSDEFATFQGIDDLVVHYDDLLDALGIARATVVGASFGAWVAAELAVFAPARVEQLVLMAPIGLRLPEHPLSDIFLMHPEQRVAALYHDTSRAPSTDGDVEAFVQAYRDMGAIARYAWKPFMANPKLEGRLRRVRARTLVVAAAQDQVVPRAHPQRYAERIADARLVVVEDVGHALDLERPEAVADVVLSFLAAEEARS